MVKRRSTRQSKVSLVEYTEKTIRTTELLILLGTLYAYSLVILMHFHFEQPLNKPEEFKCLTSLLNKEFGIIKKEFIQ